MNIEVDIDINAIDKGCKVLVDSGYLREADTNPKERMQLVIDIVRAVLSDLSLKKFTLGS